VYNQILSTPNMKLALFPHMYSWYGALYAEGGASYSFHVKAIYALFPTHNKCIISSGNFMFTDTYHSENMIVFENCTEYDKVFEEFFNDLDTYSLKYTGQSLQIKDYFDFGFLDNYKDLNYDTGHFPKAFFTAPFYTINGIGSNHFAGNAVIDLISRAKKRVWVCAQHFHDLVSFDTARETLIKAIYKKYSENPLIELKFLKQVPHSSLADKRRAAIAETLFQYVLGANQRSNTLTHDKFMIID